MFGLVGGGLARRGGVGVRVAGPTLVLRRFKIDETLSADILVDIVGRPSGITGWLLTVIGFDAETSLKVTSKEVSFKSSSLSGQCHQVVSLPSISSTHCGYSKPIKYLILGAICVIVCILLGIFIDRASIILLGFIIGGIFLVVYHLSKKIIISLETSGGMLLGLSFKRSVIENVSFDIEQALKVIGIVNQKVIESQAK